MAKIGKKGWEAPHERGLQAVKREGQTMIREDNKSGLDN